MPRFAYSARDPQGTPKRGDIEAPSRRDAVRMLSSRSLQVVSMAESASGEKKPAAGKDSAKPGFFQTSPSGGRDTAPRRHERLPFLEALCDLISSGLSAGEAVRLLSIRIKDPRLRELCAGLWERVSEGAPLSQAMSDFPKVFDEGTVNLIQAGEATGSLKDTLSRLIAHLTEQKELQRRLLTALAYPALMVVVAAGVILFFLFFLLPRLQTLLDSLGGTMPLSTRILIAFSTFTLHYGVFVVVALILGLAAFWRRNA